MTENIERNMIAALFVSSENMNQAIEFGITDAWFQNELHGNIFSEFVELVKETEWNPNTSSNVMISKGVFDRQPELLEVALEIPEWAFSLNDLSDAFDVIRVRYASRRLHNAASQIATRVTSGEDPFDVASAIIADLEDMENIGHNDERTTEQIAKELIELDTKIVGGESVGLPFPWSDLQERTHGIPYNAVSPLTGRDGRGKSRLATFLAVSWAINGIEGLIFPYEDTELRCLRNAASNFGEYDAFGVSNKFVSQQFFDRHVEAINRAAKLPLHICDSATKIEKIISLIATHKRKNDIKWVIIDGFKDIHGTGGENRTQEEVRMMRALTAAARKYKVAIIPVMHINKVADDKWISKQDITGSGDQTKSARMVMVYQDYVPDEIKNTHAAGVYDENLFILDIQKASYGSKGLKPLIKNLENGRFDEIREIDEPDEFV